MTEKHYWGFGKSAPGALQGNPLSQASEDRGHQAKAPYLTSSASAHLHLFLAGSLQGPLLHSLQLHPTSKAMGISLELD